MSKKLIVILISSFAQFHSYAQISSKYYLPTDSLIQTLKVQSLHCTNTWTKKKKRKISNREDHFDNYVYNEQGNLTEHLKFNVRDSSILERWKYTYGPNDSIVEFTRSPFGEPDSISMKRTYIYADLANFWQSKCIIDSSFIKIKDDSITVSKKESFFLVKGDTLLVDSTIRQFRNYAPRIFVKRYSYDSEGRIDCIQHEVSSSDTIRKWCKVFEYDLIGRLREITSVNNGKTRSLEKWNWNNDENELKIYTRDHRGRKSIEFFKYDEKHRLIEYSDDLNDKILRVYKMKYYENDLIKELITIAPNDDWTHIRSYNYHFE